LFRKFWNNVRHRLERIGTLIFWETKIAPGEMGQWH
jgi:hypothetical protein